VDLKISADEIKIPTIAPSDFLVFDPLNRVCVLDINFLIPNCLKGPDLERIFWTVAGIPLLVICSSLIDPMLISSQWFVRRR
jgi:hypothetical protein